MRYSRDLAELATRQRLAHDLLDLRVNAEPAPHQHEEENMDRTLIAAFALLFVIPVGCAIPAGESDEGRTGEASAALTMTEEGGVLRLVNDAATTSTVLDVNCALYADSARNIIRQRDGKDKVYPSKDDLPYESIAQLDAVPEVGPATITSLRDCAIARGYLYRLTSADVAAISAEGAAGGGVAAHARSVCTSAAGSATGCIDPCTSRVSGAGDSWLSSVVTGWVGRVYDSRAAAVSAAAAAARNETASQTQCWSQPDCLAVDAVVACMGG